LQSFLIGFLRIASLYFIYFIFFGKKTNFGESPKIGWWHTWYKKIIMSILLRYSQRPEQIREAKSLHLPSSKHFACPSNGEFWVWGYVRVRWEQNIWE
jgi:hypothetical protein